MMIEFVGAARTVTGSKHLVRGPKATVLLDCGLFQGRRRESQEKNRSLGVDPTELDAAGRVVFGATVELEDEASGDVVKYQIVGEDEADLKLGLINISSPIARALIGKEEGDTAEVQAPGGIKHFEIVAVRYV